MKLIDLECYRNDSRLNTSWPPNYTPEYSRRVDMINKMRIDPDFLSALKVYYRENPVDFILDWMTTYDPRNDGRTVPKTTPFMLFPRQVEIIAMFHECHIEKESALVEKCRDAGITMCACAYSVWAWCFIPEITIAFGSRKAEYVDKLGDNKTIFEKIRQMIEGLPVEFLPKGFDRKSSFMLNRILNRETGAQITGEGGDSIGRGGRSTLYWVDEAAHLERPELVEAALGDNTDVRIDISSVNGTGNVFYRRRKAGVEWQPGVELPKGKTRVFIFDWRDHPGKSEEWYERRRAKAEDEGLLHVFAQEVDRDYASAVQGVLIPSKWVKACIDIHKALEWPEPTGSRVASMDVADGGNDRNSMAVKRGYLVEASMCDGGEADLVARQYYAMADMIGADQWRYEINGVGAGAKAAARVYHSNAVEQGRKPVSLPKIIGWSPSHAVVNGACDVNTGELVEPGDKESIRNKDFFTNLRAQAAWKLRQLCHNSYKVRYEGADISPDDCIALSSDMEGLEELVTELSQPTYVTNPNTNKILINKTPEGTTSPNRFDGLVINVSPLRPDVDETMHVGGMGADSVEYVAVG
ncbi:terminase large subunit [Vibrio phage 1.022.O._10N.286.45.A10]|nr:terminase large subunit [Vibrio phage 1.022.O._10N.286.45.A10]